MKRFFIFLGLFIGFICSISLHAQTSEAPNCSALMPMPNQLTPLQGKSFSMHANHAAIYINNEELSFSAEMLKDIIQHEMGVKASSSTDKHAPIQLLVDRDIMKRDPNGAAEGKRNLVERKRNLAEGNNELEEGNNGLAEGNNGLAERNNSHANENQHYQLEVNAKRLIIRGATPQAVFYGVQTLHQLLIGDRCATERKEISPIRIDDTPRFAYRALMLDPARHFLPVKDVKFYIDQMARYKYNVLQLHLTDDQGWRVEIKSRPELASEQHYTQKELSELIAYAAQRHIEIVPEMDIPGHTVAILAAYPELGCTSADTIKKEVGKTVNLMLCASVDKVYEVYKDIFREMAEIFPSKFIHLGGDESVIEKNWARCERCRQQMKERGYTKASQLMIPFFDKMLGMVERAGKSPVLWCELDRIYPPANDYLFPYPKNVTWVTWRNGLTPKCIELTRQHGNPLIMAPGEYTYFDYPQLKGDLPEFNNWGMPITTLQQAYAFDPGYGLSAEEQAHIQGVMGTLWGEAMPDINRVTYMTFPRALALAEAGWTQMEYRSWDSFKERMFPNLYELMKAGVSVRVPFEIIER